MLTQKVLVPIDGSLLSLQVLPYIVRFIKPSDYTLILLHVAPEPSYVEVQPIGQDDLSIYVDQAENGISAAFYAEMQPHIRALEKAGFSVTVEVRFGKPIEEIEKFMDQADIGMVAMTTHGRTGLRRMRYGSVAEHILQHSTVPVLLYRTFGAEPVVTHGHGRETVVAG